MKRGGMEEMGGGDEGMGWRGRDDRDGVEGTNWW